MEKEINIPYINAETSALVDKELMGEYNYSIDQLMEIAGLTVAKIINQEFILKNKIKNTKNPLYNRLITQCENYEIKINEKIYETKEEYEKIFDEFDIIVDALFGFSFKGEIRQPFKTIIESMKKYENKIISIDIPSGFDIDKGNIFNTFIPKGLVSLTLPKLCSKDFKGEHFLGGR